MRREYRERTPEQIEQARTVRQQRSLERQAIRTGERDALIGEGKTKEADVLQRKIDIAQRAIDSATSTDDRKNRRGRLKGVEGKRSDDLENYCMNRFRMTLKDVEDRKARSLKTEDFPRHTKPVAHRIMGPVRLGPRESARLVLASPRIDVQIAYQDSDDIEAVTRKTFMAAAAEMAGGDRRRRVVRHAVVVPPVGEPQDRSEDRVKTILGAVRLNPATDWWLAIEHDGSEGKGQGRHLHVVWLADTPSKMGGHACMAFAARMWAELNDNPAAAQSVSLSTNMAATRDWDRVRFRNFSDNASDFVAENVVAYHDPQFAGGLWLQKPGWRADQMPDPLPIESSGKRRFGAAAHLWGWD